VTGSPWDVNVYRQASHSICGLVELRLDSLYTHLSVLSRPQRLQYFYWRHMLEEDLDGRAYTCSVVQAWALEQPIPVQQCSERKPIGLVCQLEVGQPRNVLAALRVHPHPFVISQYGGRSPCAANCCALVGVAHKRGVYNPLVHFLLYMMLVRIVFGFAVFRMCRCACLLCSC